MKEYKFRYEAPPISEIVKLVYIKADDIDMALHLFRQKLGNKTLIFSIELIE